MLDIVQKIFIAAQMVEPYQGQDAYLQEQVQITQLVQVDIQKEEKATP